MFYKNFALFKKSNKCQKQKQFFSGCLLFLFQASFLEEGVYFRKQKNMKRVVVLLVMAAASMVARSAYGQNVHIATNLLDYLNFGTINAEIGLSPVPKWSFYIKGRYNPFTFNANDNLQNRTAAVAAGAKYWFWYANSGWFLNGHAGYGIYNTGGILSEHAYEGNAAFITVGCGYALMLGKKWNLDFGMGVQTGVTSYTKYSCPRCGRIMDRGKKMYLFPSNVMVQLSRIL